MKDLTLLSVLGVLALALGLGLVFHWLYPRVDLSGELAGLFVFVAAALKLVLSKLWSLMRSSRTPPASRADR